MATFVTAGKKTKAIIRKQGHRTLCKTFIKKTDALVWARKVESEIERGLFEDTAKAKTTRFKLVLDEYYQSCTQRQLKALKFIRSHSRTIAAHLGSYMIADINSELLASYRDTRLQRVRPATVKHELGIILRALKFAVDEKGIYLPSFPKITFPQVRNARNRRVSDDEIERLTSHISNPEINLLIKLALETGMRRGELLNIHWQDINWSAKTLIIPTTKNGESREIPLTSKAMKALLMVSKRDIGALFAIKPDSLSQAFNRACKKLNISDLRFHDLRHEATTRLFELGLNVIEVSTITGHKDLTMLNRYTHLKAEKLSEKLWKLDGEKSECANRSQERF